MCRTLCPKMSFTCSIVDMFDERTGQSMRTTLKDKFADSGKMCSGVVILGLVLALVLTQENQNNRPQHLIHVRLADQVSLYKTPDLSPRFKHLPRDMANASALKPMFEPNTGILRIIT